MKNFSFGICAYNEEENIGELLDNISNHKTPHTLEKIIVVASGCTDRTAEIAKKHANLDSRISLIVEDERRGKYLAVNRIFRENTSEVLIMIDADCLIADGAVDQLIQSLEDKKVGAVCGRTVPLNKEFDGFWGYISHFRYKVFDESALRAVKNKSFYHISGYLYAIRGGLAKEIELPQIVQDDLYVGLETIKRGYLVDFEPSALVNILHPTKFSAFVKQRKRIRLGHMQIEKITGKKVFNTIPAAVAPLVLKAMRKDPAGILYTAAAAILEQYAAILAYLDFRKGKIKLDWDYIETSKKLK